MKDILLIAKAHIATAMRERVTLFWFLIFPVFLLTVLTLIFGQIGNEGEISFDITLINQERSATAEGRFSTMIETVFLDISRPKDDSTEPLFSLYIPEEHVDLDAFLESELTELRRGHRAAVLVIPDGFDDMVMAALMEGSSVATESAGLHYS